MRYDEAYVSLVRRAVQLGGVDLESFVSMAQAQGLSEERVRDLLVQDVEEGGPLFGKFFRDLEGAASTTVMAAKRQGESAALAAARELISLAELDDVTASADPEQLQRIDDSTGDLLPLTWQAELRNTCHLCLPLHGVTRLASEWKALGLHPDSIHPSSWNSACHCKLVDADQADAEELLAPLKRVGTRTPGGLTGRKRTVRGVAQQDLLGSIDAVEKSRETIQGRRQLKILGEANKTPEQRDNERKERNRQAQQRRLRNRGAAQLLGETGPTRGDA